MESDFIHKKKMKYKYSLNSCQCRVIIEISNGKDVESVKTTKNYFALPLSRVGLDTKKVNFCQIISRCKLESCRFYHMKGMPPVYLGCK